MNTNTIAQRLKELRIINGETQTDIAKALNVKRSTYSLWEIGKNEIPLDKLNTISNKYNVSIDYLTGISKNNIDNFVHIAINIKDIGIRIKIIRKLNNYTLANLAKELSVHLSTISNYENGKTVIPISFLINFAKLTNTSIDYICGKTDTEDTIIKKTIS